MSSSKPHESQMREHCCLVHSQAPTAEAAQALRGPAGTVSGQPSQGLISTSPARFHLLLLKLPRKSRSLTSSSLLAARDATMGEAAAELDMLAACGLAAPPNRRSKSLSRKPRPAAQAAESTAAWGSSINDVRCYSR